MLALLLFILIWLLLLANKLLLLLLEEKIFILLLLLLFVEKRFIVWFCDYLLNMFWLLLLLLLLANRFWLFPWFWLNKFWLFPCYWNILLLLLLFVCHVDWVMFPIIPFCLISSPKYGLAGFWFWKNLTLIVYLSMASLIIYLYRSGMFCICVLMI